MTMKSLLSEDMKNAMKNRDRLKLDVIRYLLSEIKNTEIDSGTLSDEAILQLIGKQIKQIKETLVDYEKAGNLEVIQQEKMKISVLESYLPKQLSDDELSSIINEIKNSNPQLAIGQIIGLVKAKVGAQADGSRIASLVKK